MLTSKLGETVTTDRERLELRDGEVEGLELCVGRVGSKTFRLRYRRQSDGRKLAVTLGRFDKDAPPVTKDTRPGVGTRLSLKGARKLVTLSIDARAMLRLIINASFQCAVQKTIF
jgi:Arm DNA-binding domain